MVTDPIGRTSLCTIGYRPGEIDLGEEGRERRVRVEGGEREGRGRGEGEEGGWREGRGRGEGEEGEEGGESEGERMKGEKRK